MKLLFVYDCLYPDSLGGVEHRNYRLAKALAARGHEVTLAGWGDPESAVIESAPNVRRLLLPHAARLHNGEGKRTLGPTLRFARAVRTLDLAPYDLIETANIPYLHLFPLARAAKRAKKPFVVTWHEYFGPLWRSYKSRAAAPFFGAIEKQAAKLGTSALAVSPLTARRLAEVRGHSIGLLPNGVDLEQIRKALTFPLPTAPFVYAGRLIPEKRLDLLIRATALLPEEPSRPGPLVEIIGEGPDKERLLSLRRHHRQEKRILFTGKLPEAEDVWQRLAGARAALQPSAREGFGMFALEAAALGKPVLYCESENNAIAELIRDGHEGLSSPADPASLAERMKLVLENEALVEELGRAGQQRAQAFDWRILAIEAEAFFTRHKENYRRLIR